MSDLTVWKYIAPVQLAPFRIGMPAGARLLHVASQHADVCVWALVDPTARLEMRRFLMVGTGQPVPDLTDQGDAYHYVGTSLMQGDALVLHLFELAPPPPTDVDPFTHYGPGLALTP